MKWQRILLVFLLILLSASPSAMANNKVDQSVKKMEQVKIPSHVLDIAKENTYPNPTQDLPYLQPSEFTQKIIKTSKVKIENPNLIRMLNETSVNNSPFSLGLRATIYLGEWPLNYDSIETAPNWQYQKINTNYFDNRGGKTNYKIHYVQESQKAVRGGLTAKVAKSEDVRKMMLLKAMEKTQLPLSFDTIIGAGTKKITITMYQLSDSGICMAMHPLLMKKEKLRMGKYTSY